MLCRPSPSAFMQQLMKPFLFSRIIASLDKVLGMHICDEVLEHITRSLTGSSPSHSAQGKKETVRKKKLKNTLKGKSLFTTMLIQGIKPTSLHRECLGFILVKQESSRKQRAHPKILCAGYC